MRDALRVGGGAESALRGEVERQRHAGGDCFAVQQRAIVSGVRFQRVREGVAEI